MKSLLELLLLFHHIYMCMSICSDIRVIRCTSTLLQTGQEPNSSKGLTFFQAYHYFFHRLELLLLESLKLEKF